MRRMDRADTPTEMGRRPVTWRQRAAALISLGTGLLLTVTLGAFMIRHGRFALVALAGFVLAAASSWWVITGIKTKRVLGAAGLLAGLGLILAATIKAGLEAESPVLRVGLVAVLVAITIGSARLALVHDIHELRRRRHRHPPPEHPVLICNPWSGGGKVEQFGLIELAADMGIETVLLDHGLDLETLARDAVARGADCLGMAGGDGSQALVASIAVEHGLPFVCISAGTRNHFALDLGLDRDDPRSGLKGFRDGVERHVDYATVNGRFFVNNVSLGIYATIVQSEGYRDAKLETTRALLPELLGDVQRPFDLQFNAPNGVEVDGAFLIQISNNPYVLGPSLDTSQRRSVSTGQLGIVAVTASTGLDAAKVLTMTALGQRKRTKNWHEFSATRFEVRSRSGAVDAGIDGEALSMDAPLEFEIHPGGLRLLVPEENLQAADRRRARGVSVWDLMSIARGTEPHPALGVVSSSGQSSERQDPPAS